MEAIIPPRVPDTLRGEDVRRTGKMVNCQKQRIKSLYDNKIVVELGTRKQTAQPYLQPAAYNHGAEYKSIIEDSLKNA